MSIQRNRMSGMGTCWACIHSRVSYDEYGKQVFYCCHGERLKVEITNYMNICPQYKNTQDLNDDEFNNWERHHTNANGGI